jgi:hypothetical protein
MKPSLLVITLVLLPVRLAAQEVRALLNATAGTATDERGVHASALSLAPVLVLAPSTSTLVSVRATGTSFGVGRWSLGAGLGLTMQSARSSRFGLRLDASATGSLSSYDTKIGALSAAPVAELRLGHLRLYGGAEGAIAATVSSSPLRAAPDAAQRRTSVGPLFGADLRIDAAQLAYRESHQRVAGVSIVDRRFTLGQQLSALQWNAGIGIRDDGAEQDLFGQVALRLPLGGPVALTGAASWYPANRVLGTVGGREVRAGIQLGFGGGQVRRHDPRALHGLPAPRHGFTRLTIKAPQASCVEIAGDWNRWTPIAAQHARDDVWYADVALAPGNYRYAFRVDGRWEVPANATLVDDGFGGQSAVAEVTSSQEE